MIANFATVIMAGHTALMLIFVTALMALMPRFMRPDVYFSVTVSPDFPVSDTGRAVRRQYQRRVILAGAIVLALTLGLHPFIGDAGRALSGAAGVFVLIGVLFWAFISARRQVLPHAATPSMVREAGLAPRKALAIGGPAMLVGPFLIIAAAATFLALRYDSLPARIPMHYNAAGEVDRFADKSIGSVFGLLLVAVLVCVMLATIAWSMGRGMKRSRATGPAAQREAAMLSLATSILLLVQYLIAALFSSIAVVIVLPPEQAGQWVMVLALAGVVGLMVVVIGMLLRYQNLPPAPAAEPVGDGTPDSRWKWGMIYYNPDDPALWVEKRFGIGYTTNMARPAAWVLLGGILFFTGGMIAVAIWATK